MKKFSSLHRVVLSAACAALFTLLLACAGGGGGAVTQPVVAIAAPTNGSVFAMGEKVAVQSASADANGITRVELYVDGQLAQTSNVPAPADTKQFNVIQEWAPTTPGAHSLVVRAFNLAGLSGEQTVAITVNANDVTPANTATSSSSATAVSIQPTSAPNAAVTVIVTATPLATIPNATTPTQPLAGPTVCIPNSQFVADKTIPDGTTLQPGEAFVKTWVLRNSGGCAWGPGFTLNYVSGAGLSSVNQAPLPPAQPGQAVEVSVNMQAPAQPGNYRTDWRPRAADGIPFGTPISVVINVPAPNPPPTAPTATAVPVVFKPSFPGDMDVQATWFGDSINIGARAAVIESGDEPNGNGIAYVEFFIQDLQGREIARKRENNPPYCYFAEQDGECAAVDIGTDRFRWSEGKPIRDGWYLIRAVAHSQDGRIKVGERALHVTIPEDSLENFFVNRELPVDDHLSFELAFEASVSGSHLDTARVERVEFYVVDYDGNIVASRPERNPRYCAFGGGDNGADCPMYNFAANGGKWQNGAPVNPTEYILRMIAYATDGKIAADTFTITIDRVQ